MTTFVTSDLHLLHDNIIRYNRPTRRGATGEEMTEILIADWNATVAPTDPVYILGDITLKHNAATVEALIRRLNGELHLVLGNHDSPIRANLHLRDLFHSVTDMLMYRHIHEVEVDGVVAQVKCSYAMSHYPMWAWRDMERGAFHLYGHCHGLGAAYRIPRSMDVGIDARQDDLMRPWTIDEIYARLRDEQICHTRV